LDFSALKEVNMCTTSKAPNDAGADPVCVFVVVSIAEYKFIEI
jgi:hypothetical protein